MKSFLFRTKPLISTVTHEQLKRCLSAFDLTLLGIGAIIGAGIFVLTGVVAATKAGPAVTLSYIVAGTACAFTALAYAELASSLEGCGSAYGYAFAGLGEFVAWLIGWDLLLEYSISCSTIAIGWSGYVQDALAAIGFPLLSSLTKTPAEGGIINLPAFGIIILLAILLIIGVRESSRFNSIMVLIKLLVIGIFITIALPLADLRHWSPFMPFGWTGVMHGAALVFFAYIGFDAVSTTTEEAINPQRDLPIGIIASLVICTLIYVAVSGLLTTVTSYQNLDSQSPVSDALLDLGYRFAGGIIAAGVIAGLTTGILVMYYGLTRIFLAMSRDGLLPKTFSKIHPDRRTPTYSIAISGLAIATVAGFVPISDAAELVNIGTLAAFCVVCIGVIVLRITQPNMHRPFKTPFSPLIPLLGIAFCIYLMLSLPLITWIRFIGWMAIGLVIYFLYSRFHSVMNKD